MGSTRSVHFGNSEEEQELEDWIDSRVEDGIFNNFSHGVRYCIKKMREDNVEEMV